MSQFLLVDYYTFQIIYSWKISQEEFISIIKVNIYTKSLGNIKVKLNCKL